MCSNYWMIEFKDGEEWKPVLPTSTLQESATETLSGAPINYSVTITYNFAGMLLDSSNNGAYIPAEGVFTTTKDMDEIVLRFGQAVYVLVVPDMPENILTGHMQAARHVFQRNIRVTLKQVRQSKSITNMYCLKS